MPNDAHSEAESHHGMLYRDGDELAELDATRFAIYSAWSSISVLRMALWRTSDHKVQDSIKRQLATISLELNVLYADERLMVAKQLADLRVSGSGESFINHVVRAWVPRHCEQHEVAWTPT